MGARVVAIYGRVSTESKTANQIVELRAWAARCAIQSWPSSRIEASVASKVVTSSLSSTACSKVLCAESPMSLLYVIGPAEPVASAIDWAPTPARDH